MKYLNGVKVKLLYGGNKRHCQKYTADAAVKKRAVPILYDGDPKVNGCVITRE